VAFVTLPPGSRLGRFQIVELLGQGGMGVVYKAIDTGTGRAVALKVLPRELLADDRLLARFEREAHGAAAVVHPNVVALFFAGTEAGLPVMALELAAGGTLKARLKQGALPWEEAARLAADIARGLAAIHAAGLVHRDLKPENILLDEAGRPKLADFGLVRGEKSGAGNLTKTGEMLGTLEYIAPEQADDSKKADHRADLYSFGAMLYAMLVGRPPFEGQGYALVKQHLADRPRPPRELVPGIPARLERLVLGLLAKDPADRPGSASAVARELDAIAAEPGGGDRSPRRGWLALALVALLAVIAAGIFAVARPRGPGPVAPPPPPEEHPAAKEPPDLSSGFREGPSWKLEGTWGRFDLKHAGGLTTVAFSRGDPGRAFSGGNDGTARLWDLATGRELASVVVGPGIICLASSPDGKRAIIGDAKGVATIWEVEKGTSRVIERRSGGSITAVDWSPEGKRVLAAGGVNPELTIRLLDVETGRLLTELAPGSGFNQAVKFLADGRRAVSSGNEAVITVWELDGGTALTHVTGTRRMAMAAVTPDGKWALSADTDAGSATLWDLEQGTPPRTIEKTEGEALGVAIRPDHSRVLVGGRFRLDLLDLASLEKPRWSIELDWAMSAVFSSDGKRVLAGGSDHTVRLLDSDSGRDLVERAGLDGSVSALSGGKVPCALATTFRSIVVREVRAGGASHTLGFDGPFPVALSPDGSRVLVLRGNASAVDHVLLDVATGKTLWAEGQKYAGASAAISGDGRSGLAGCVDGSILRFPTTTGVLDVIAGGFMQTDLRTVTAVAFLGRGADRVIAGGANGGVTIVGPEDHKSADAIPACGRHDAPVTAVAGSPDEARALSGDAQGQVKLWTFAGKSSVDLVRHPSGITALAFSPDGLLAIAASKDGTISITNVKGVALGKIDLASSTDHATSLAFDAAGSLLVGTARGVVHRFRITTR
jgi:WD40 repeat protein